MKAMIKKFLKLINPWEFLINPPGLRTITRHSDSLKISFEDFFKLPNTVKTFPASLVKEKMDTYLEAQNKISNPTLEQILKLLVENKSYFLVFEPSQNETSMTIIVCSRDLFNKKRK